MMSGLSHKPESIGRCHRVYMSSQFRKVRVSNRGNDQADKLRGFAKEGSCCFVWNKVGFLDCMQNTLFLFRVDVRCSVHHAGDGCRRNPRQSSHIFDACHFLLLLPCFELFCIMKPVSYVIIILFSNKIVNIQFSFLYYTQFSSRFIVHFDNYLAGGLFFSDRPWSKAEKMPPASDYSQGACIKIGYLCYCIAKPSKVYRSNWPLTCS